MAELINLNELDELQTLHLMLNQLQLISIQLYRLHDIIAVAGLQLTPSQSKVTEQFNPELKAMLDHLEAGRMPFAAEIDLLGDQDGSQEEQGSGQG